MFRDSIIVLMHTMNESKKLVNQAPAVTQTPDMMLEATTMALHGVAALEQERVQNLTLACKVGTKRSAEKAYISDKVDLQEMVNCRRLEKDLTVSFKRDNPNSRTVENHQFRGGFCGGRSFRGRFQRGGYNNYYAGKENSKLYKQ